MEKLALVKEAGSIDSLKLALTEEDTGIVASDAG
jgi:hypothetical protein